MQTGDVEVANRRNVHLHFAYATMQVTAGRNNSLADLGSTSSEVAGSATTILYLAVFEIDHRVVDATTQRS